MKTSKTILKLFFTGFFLAFCLTSLTQCPIENPTTPADEAAKETEATKKFSQTVISAFQSGDKQKVIDLMYDEYKDIYGKQLEASTARMTDFAAALENRKIILANELYAEYELTVNGITFTIAYSNEGDGIWKLERF